ncbi:MAG: hypothetical protein HY646_15830 [Acidobacteria bacterium]|nr:hypothetical protein [Acidobacteriota bacterium]
MFKFVVWIWLFISVAWFAINSYFLERHDFNFWFVASLPFGIGLLFLIGARFASGSWKEPPDFWRHWMIAALVLCLVAPVIASGQQHDHGIAPVVTRKPINREAYVLVAARANQPPRIDGIPDEEIWRASAAAGDFIQQEPNEGEPSTERTEVRIVYDPSHIYIAVHAYDSDPQAINATEMRRDSPRILDEDNFQVIIDTFNDLRSGYMFVTNPLGAKLEQQISEEGEGDRRGNNSNVNRNWDGVWDVATRRTDTGWTAEIAIPTATLRFRESDEQTWGINFMRSIRRKNEQVFWAPIPKAYGLTRVSLAGSLIGLRGLSQGMDLRIKPFLIGGVRSRTSPSATKNTFQRDSGLDVKYGITSGLNLDVTVKTDFAQVEADEQQVNLTRFGLFFPEKRDFFLENAGQFLVGTQRQEADLFFTRQIGLSSTGQPIPIIAGARLTGKIGANNLALMDIQTDEAFGKPGDNFLVTRYSRDVLSRSRIGGLFINKRASDGSHFNRTMAVDTTMALGSSLTINGFAAKTNTPGITDGDQSYYGRIGWRDPAWNLWGQYIDIQDNFKPEVGFVTRRGIRTTQLHFGPTPRPKRLGVRLMEPMLQVTYTTDQDNRLVSRRVHHMVAFNMEDGTYINFIYNDYLEHLDEVFEIRRDIGIPTGTYRFGEMIFQFNTNPSRRVYERFQYSPQTFYGGFRKDIDAAVGIRANTQLAAELSYRRNDVKLPWGEFEVNLGIVRVDYALSPKMTLRSLTQYNSSTRELSNSIRFNFIYRPGSDLYVVYNDLYNDTAGAATKRDRQLVLKWNYLLSR